MPDNWIMTQEWRDVFFLHWPVPADWISHQVPAELELDLFDGYAWIGVVGFKAEGTRPRMLPPVPGTKDFLEVNVRTYVKYGERSGIYFFSLDADSLLAVKAATTGDFLPYRQARMKMKKQGDNISFKSRRTAPGSFPETIDFSYRIAAGRTARTKLEKWLTERYCLWTKPKGKLLRLDIEHSPWSLHYVTGEIRTNSMASFLPESLHLQKPMAHYAKRKKVRFFPPIMEK